MKTDYTQLQCYINCPRQYKHKYINGLARVTYDESNILSFGTAIHSGLEVYNETCNMDEGCKKFMSEFSGQPENDRRSLETGLIALKQYENYAKHNFSNWKVLETEQLGEYRIGNHIYLCKIDVVIESQGNIYVVDYKTTQSTNKPKYMDKFQMSFQPMGYMSYIKQKYGKCAGFIPVVCFLSYGVRKGFECNWDFTIVNYTEEHFKYFNEVVEKWLNVMEKDTDYLPNYGSCGDYFGCEFVDLCKSCNDEFVRSSMYEVVNTKEYLDEIGKNGKKQEGINDTEN